MNRRTLLIILGNLTAFGPFVTDFYLPCLPTLASCFSVTASGIQLSLTTGMLGLAAGQVFLGSLTDKYGRKRPLLWGLVLFVFSTVGCMLSGNIAPFIFFRLLQGLTGACGLVISKAIIADSFSTEEQGRSFAILAAVQGVAPIVAPVAGGVAFSLTSWQGAFALLGLWGLWLLWACRRVNETLPVGERLTIPVWKTFRCYGEVLRNGRYLVMNLLQGFSSAALIGYISASPFIFQEHFNLTPLQYSLCFAGNAVGLVTGSSIVIRIKRLQAAARWGVSGLAASAVLSSAALCYGWAFALYELFLFPLLFCVGMLTPVGITLALRSVEEHRGVASALLGTTPFLLGGIVAPLTGMGDIIHPTSLLITLCAFVCVIMCFLKSTASHVHISE